MSAQIMSPQPWFRRLLLLLAGILGVQAAWTVTAELVRSPRSGFPADVAAASAAAPRRSTTLWAARFGLVRGDLWAEHALTYADLMWSHPRSDTDIDGPQMIARARAAAVRALLNAPHDARIWLLLASLESRFDWLNGKAAAALRMSHYTGPNERELIPLRLLVSVQSGALADAELRDLLQTEIRTIIRRRPELKPAIVSAYREGLPAGRRLIEKTLAELDPTLLSLVRPAEGSR